MSTAVGDKFKSMTEGYPLQLDIEVWSTEQIAGFWDKAKYVDGAELLVWLFANAQLQELSALKAYCMRELPNTLLPGYQFESAFAIAVYEGALDIEELRRLASIAFLP